MTFQFGQDQELDELRTSHNITKILTTPFGKKVGCATTKASNNTKGGSAGFFNQLSIPSQYSCRASLNSKEIYYGL